MKETARIEQIEMQVRKENRLFKDSALLSELSQARIKSNSTLPNVLVSDHKVVSSKAMGDSSAVEIQDVDS